MNLVQRGAEIAAEITRIEAELVEAERVAGEELQRVAGDIAMKAVTQDDGSKRRRGIERTLNAKRGRLAQLRDAAVEIERRAHEEAEREHENELGRAATKLDRAIKARASASKNLRRAVSVVELAAAEVGRHRPLVDEAVKAYEMLLRPDEPFTWPTNPDEPWEISEDTVTLLSDGPLKPLADRAEERREREKIQAEQDAETLASFAMTPTEARLRLLSDRLHPQAREILAGHQARVEEQRVDREARDAKRGLQRVGEERRADRPLRSRADNRGRVGHPSSGVPTGRSILNRGGHE